jgi:UDPglucose 6-dehydrogenase
MSKIAIIGTGYVGLTTGACFSALGHEVVCADIDEAKVERLKQGDIPILEAGLEEIVREGLESGRLSFVLGAATAAADCEFAYLCVPTPQGEDGSADLSYIEQAARQIAEVLPSESVVVNKSTVPVGSTRVVERALGRDDVAVVSNPEFLREGSAVHDFMHPDRIVIGADDQSAAIKVASLYLGVAAPLIVTDPASAETIKYAANSFLATKISFINAVAAICEAVGADINDVALGIGYDKRIGSEFLKPGPGFGGSCFTPDETVLVRLHGATRLCTFAELWEQTDGQVPAGTEVLAWSSDDTEPAFHPVAALTRRPYDGDLVSVRTKMGRSLTVTADHPLVVCDGAPDDPVRVVEAGDVETTCWLPIAQGSPLTEEPQVLDLLSLAEAGGVAASEIIVELSDGQLQQAMDVRSQLPPNRRYDLPRTRCLRVDELRSLGIDPSAGRLKTAKNGTTVPARLPLDADAWRTIGLYLAEGHVTVDGRRHRMGWSFHPRDEEELVDFVVGFWSRHGVKVDARVGTTTHQVTLSSRILAVAFRELGLGWGCYEHRIPDQIWCAGPDAKRALLRGLWDGDGSWSLVNGGPSVVLEYGTVSPMLADGMLRLLGDLEILARHKIGRSAKSTTDAHFLTISGTEQIEQCYWLFPPWEGWTIAEELSEVQKVIAPTGYRRLHKHAAWVRITSVERRPATGDDVYSLEVPGPHTVVTSGGLVAHNCFPKDTRAMVKIAEEGGYDFHLLKGVIQVNDEQYDRTAEKAIELMGGDVDGKQVAAWGLTFKARTADMRESPSLEVLGRLAARGAKVRAYDPAVSHQLDGIEVVADPYDACDGADVLLVLTEWDEFKWLDLGEVKDRMATAAVVDARNLLDRSALIRRGFTFRGIGRR